MDRPVRTDYPEYFEGYIQNVSGENPVGNLDSQSTEVKNMLRGLSEEKADYAYAEGKWTIKQLIGHLIDTERVMNYRALAIARNEKQQLPGFDENYYAANSNAGSRTIDDLLDEYEKVREATISLFKSFDKSVLDNRGIANNTEVTVRSLIFMVPGHERHHIKILKERYLK